MECMERIFGRRAGLHCSVTYIACHAVAQSCGCEASCEGAGAAEALEREADHCSRSRGCQERGWSRQRCLEAAQGAAQLAP